MPRQINRLSARTVQTIARKGRHSDGAGLYLVVDRNGAKRWAFLYRDRRTQRLREMGLGGIGTVSLACARGRAAQARAMLAAGKDPIAESKAVGDDGDLPTFGSLANQFLAAMEPAWRNDRHRAQWRSTLSKQCKPLRELRVDLITTGDVLGVLTPIWQSTPETASRVRGRIEAILDAAKAKGLRQGDNPARWRGHLDKLLPRRLAHSRGHHAAMAFVDLPAFIARLRDRPTVAGLALEFLILTAARTGEVIGADWQEIDPTAKVWVVPAARMKGGESHVVPLCARAMEILREAEKFGRTGFVFPGQRSGCPLSNMAFAALLRRMKIEEATAHGFRSSFRDWCGECTSYPRDVAEAALAHTIPNKVEAAYRRGTAIEKRRRMMEEWAAFCGSTGAKVVHLRQIGGM